jgi:hypothetical protein
LGRIARIFFAGLLVLLPILVTLIVTVWFAQLLQSYAGPDSLIGRLIVLLGLNLVSSATGAYFLGFLIISAASPMSTICRSASFPSSTGAVTRTISRACARCGASSGAKEVPRFSG